MPDEQILTYEGDAPAELPLTIYVGTDFLKRIYFRDTETGDPLPKTGDIRAVCRAQWGFNADILFEFTIDQTNLDAPTKAYFDFSVTNDVTKTITTNVGFYDIMLTTDGFTEVIIRGQITFVGSATDVLEV